MEPIRDIDISLSGDDENNSEPIYTIKNKVKIPKKGIANSIMNKDIGQKILEIERLIKKTSSFLRKLQLEEESLYLQRQIGLENKRKIAKELGCDIRSVYKFIHKEIK